MVYPPSLVRLPAFLQSMTPRSVTRNRSWIFPLLLGCIALGVSFQSPTWFKLILLVLFVLVSLYMAALDAAWKETQNRSRHDIAGALGFITERVDRRQSSKSALPKQLYIAELQNQQIRLLDLARRAIAEESGVPPESLWANWCVERAQTNGGPAQFQVEFFHGDAHHRTPGTSHPILADLPGAAKAFSTTQVALVDDTHHPSVAGYFQQDRVYRCILSVPVRVAANGEQWVIGVVNFDSAVPKSFSIGMHRAVADFVYLIGLCEGLKRWA